MPKVGDPIPLDHKLFDGNSGKFVRAYVRDFSGSAVAGSPATLSHIGEGRYINNSLVMPDSPLVKASYIVYDDALFTTESPIYTHGTDVFERRSLDQIVDILQEIQGSGWMESTDTLEKIRDLLDQIIVQANATSQPEIIAEVLDDGQVEGQAAESQSIDAESDDDIVEASMESEETTVDAESDPKLQSEVEEC